jgi:hypothetical protein
MRTASALQPPSSSRTNTKLDAPVLPQPKTAQGDTLRTVCSRVAAKPVSCVCRLGRRRVQRSLLPSATGVSPAWGCRPNPRHRGLPATQRLIEAARRGENLQGEA